MQCVPTLCHCMCNDKKTKFSLNINKPEKKFETLGTAQTFYFFIGSSEGPPANQRPCQHHSGLITYVHTHTSSYCAQSQQQLLGSALTTSYRKPIIFSKIQPVRLSMEEKMPYDFKTNSQGVAVTVLGSLSKRLKESRYFFLCCPRKYPRS